MVEVLETRQVDGDNRYRAYSREDCQKFFNVRLGDLVSEGVEGATMEMVLEKTKESIEGMHEINPLDLYRTMGIVNADHLEKMRKIAWARYYDLKAYLEEVNAQNGEVSV